MIHTSFSTQLLASRRLTPLSSPAYRNAMNLLQCRKNLSSPFLLAPSTVNSVN